MLFSRATLASALTTITLAQNLVRDPGVYGPALELVFRYNTQWPTGIAVSASGRKFSNYPPGLDPGNLNNGSNGRFTVAELTGTTTQTPYPNRKWNNPPGGSINYTTTPPTGANYQDYLIGVQSVIVDSADRLWILDTGRAFLPDGSVLVTATYGGPKLIGVDLKTNTVIQTIVFPNNVAYPDSYLNDVRVDLNPALSSSGKGFAYITDSSLEGRNGIVIVDLGTGKSWRRLENHPSVRPEQQFVAYIWGTSLYSVPGAPGDPQPLTYIGFGSDGIALSADGKDLYYGAVASRYLYSVPTARLRADGGTGKSDELLAQAAVQSHGQKGVSDGFETDTNGFIYHGNMEQNAIGFYNPANGTVQTFVRDPRLSWVDTMSVATDGYLYFTDNQLGFSASFYPGTDRRQKPYTLWRAKLPNGGTKIGVSGGGNNPSGYGHGRPTGY